MNAQDPRTLTLLRHVACLCRARGQTARAIQEFRQSRALILQRKPRQAGEESPEMPFANGHAMPFGGRSGQAGDPARMTTAEWMRWRVHQLHKRK